MTEMSTGSLKYSLAVILVTCSLFIGSDTQAAQNGHNTGAFSSASANAFAGAGTSANAFAGASASANANAGADLSGALNNRNNAFTGAFEETGLLSGDGRKEIRNYNNRGSPYNNNANRGTKSYGTPSGDVGGLNDRRANRNMNGKGFKCKWENGDYWENTDSEGDGNECEDGDDGQYRPEKYENLSDGQYRPEKYENVSDGDISEFKKYQPRLELQPPLLYKTRPVITYYDGETQEFDGSSENDFLTNTRYTGRIGTFGTTPKYDPLANTLKPPEYGSGVAFGTIPSAQPIWNRRITSNRFSSSSKPAWASGHDISASFDTTSKPTTIWNTGYDAAANAAASAAAKAAASAAAGSFSSTRKYDTLWNKNDGIPVASTTAKPPKEWNIVIYDGDSTGKIPPPRKPGTPWNFRTTSKPGVNWNTGFSSNLGPNWNLDYGTTSAVGIPGKQVVKTGVTPVNFGLTKTKPLSSDISVTAPRTESVIAPLDSYGSQFGIQNANTYAGAYAGASGTSGIASNSPEDATDIEKSDYSSGFTKPYNGINQQPHSNTGSALGITTDYNKIGYGHLPQNTQSLSTLNTFENTKRLHGGITGPISFTTTPHATTPGFTSSYSGTSRIRPAGYSEIESTGAQLGGSNPWLGKQSISGNNPWLEKVISGSKSTPGITSDIWSGTSGIRPGEQSESKTWSGVQPVGSIRTTSEGYDDTYDPMNCSCRKGLKIPSKTYYPAGTGDGNVPSNANTYQPLSSNNGTESYPGGGNITPRNLANPFLFGAKGSNPSDTSRLWNSGITTTVKPIGKGNPFLDRSWSTPKPGYGGSNVNDDRNVISFGQGNTKPIGQGNPFLENAKRRGNIEINRDKGVIPFEGRKLEGHNPFIGSGSGSSGLDGSLATGQLASSSASAIAGSGTYANVKSGNNDGFYSTRRNYPGGEIDRSIASGNPSVNNIPGRSLASPGIAGRPGSEENNSAASLANAYSESHAESFAQASGASSSFANANSFSTSGSDNPQNRNWSPPIGGIQNSAGSNGPSSGVQTTGFTNSAGSWAGNNPINVKG